MSEKQKIKVDHAKTIMEAQSIKDQLVGKSNPMPLKIRDTIIKTVELALNHPERFVNKS